MRVSTTRLRRIALRHQGLTGHRRLGTGLKGARQVIKQLGYIQIDTISVVARAHHHTLWSRVSGYRDDYLNTLVRQGDAFEYWGHAAAYLPMRDYRYSLVRKHAIKRGERHWARSSDQRLMHYVLDRIHAEGPLKARDFDDARTTSTGWWDWKPAKRALEQLYMQGDLMSAGRDGFEKRYDLPERLLPADVATTEPTTTEYATHLVDTTLRAHGITTAQSVTYGRPGTAVRAAVRQVLAERLAAGSLTRLDVDGDHFYGPPAAVGTSQRPLAPVVRILSPFDNAAIQRKRLVSLFGFDYQLECYVTARSRRWGYFCLPLLFADRFVGRMDCKAHRESGCFEIKALFLEASVPESFYAACARTVVEYAAYLGCTEIEVTRMSPARCRRRFCNLLHAARVG